MKILIFGVTLILAVGFSYGQNTSETKKSDIGKMVESRQFVFTATSASPMRAPTVHLSPGYTVVVSADTVTSNLPYYGRAYQAPMNPSDAGIKFISTNFSYVAKDRGKKGWAISVKPEDITNGSQLYFSIAPDGRTSLRVISNDRQSISFNGLIKPRT